MDLATHAHPAGRRRRAALHEGALLLPDGPVDGHPLEGRHAPGLVADFYVDTTSVIERKVQAFDQYVSQGYEGQFARKVVEARDGRHGMHAETSYAEPFLLSRSVTYDSLPVAPRLLEGSYVANNLPGDRLLAWNVPSATPPEAYRLRR